MVRLHDVRQGRQVALDLPDRVAIYVCGVTPYDSMHLGHVAVFVTFDVLARRLAELGHTVTLVRNITDVDDPILGRALATDTPYDVLVESEIAQLKKDLEQLDLGADAEPRVSDHIGAIVDAITEIEARGLTYELDGRVYFSVADYGRFGEHAKLPLDQMLELSARRGGDPDTPGKRHPLDFVLWQPSRPGEPTFETRYGVGRPGWHIGCTAMARTHLGDRIQIHGGGSDLVFPHHEAETAQNLSLATPLTVDYWFNTALVGYQGEKMSKSLGNIVLFRDLVGRYEPAAVRLALAAKFHPLEGCEWFDSDIDHGVALLATLRAAAARTSGADNTASAAAVRERLDDNLDLPGAVRALAECAQAALAPGDDSAVADRVRAAAAVLGVTL